MEKNYVYGNKDAFGVFDSTREVLGQRTDKKLKPLPDWTLPMHAGGNLIGEAALRDLNSASSGFY